MVYSSDEAICVRATDDFDKLAPESNRLASGSDGDFDALAPWVLTSVSVDFEESGVEPGHVVKLNKTGSIKPAGDFLAVESVAGGTVTLRRLGMDAGKGRPPGGSGLSGVVFDIKTLNPQSESASYEINGKYGIDLANLTLRSSTYLEDVRQLERLCVEMVLRDRYRDMAKPADNGYDSWLMKSRDYERYVAETGRLVHLRWDQSSGQKPSSIPSGRISR
jgi:hypothetical protein